MSVVVDKVENNVANLTITVAAEKVNEAMQNVYKRNRNKYSLPGFRKGKVSYSTLVRQFGKGFFLEDAVNDILPAEYAAALDESGLEVVSEPTLNFTQVAPDQDLIFTVEVAVKPEVTLGEYKGLEVPKTSREVTEEDVMAIVKEEQKKNAVNKTVDDRAVAAGDVATIDFEGFIDGVAFDGGKGEDYALEIGSNSFIPGFEDQIIGHSTGEEFDVNVTFPEEYHSETLAGKPAVFKVTVKKIEEKELPELDDEFASEVSDFETLEEYKKNILETEIAKKEAAADRAKANAAVEKAVENAEMVIPEAMVKAEVKDMINNYEASMQKQGLTLEQYFEYFGQTREQFEEQTKPSALSNIKTRLVLEAVAKAENIEVTEEDIDAELDKMALQYQMEKDQMKNMVNMDLVKEDIAITKAHDLIVAEAKEVEAE